jgi:hypothetical protein
LFSVHLSTDGYEGIPVSSYIQPHNTAFVLFPKVVNIYAAENKRQSPPIVAHKAAPFAALAHEKSG